MITSLLNRIPILSKQFGINASSLRRKLASGFAWAVVAKVAISFFGVVLNMLLARILTPAEVGEYFLILSVMSIVGSISSLGMGSAAVKLLSESLAIGRGRRARQVIQQVIGVNLVGILAGCLFFVFGGGQWLGSSFWGSAIIGNLSIFIAVWMAVSNLQALAGEIFRGLQNMRWASLFGSQGATTRLLTITLLTFVWLGSFQGNLKLVLLLSIVSNGITLVAALGLLWRPVSVLDNEQGILLRHDLFSLAWPLWVSSFGFLILNQADVILLGALRPVEEVALYGFASRLSLIVSTPLMITNAVLPPIIAELYTQGQKQRLEKILRTSATLLSMPTLGVFMLFAFWGAPFLRLLFGEYYVQAYWPLLILSFGQLVNVLTGSCGILMNMSGFHKQFMYINTFSGMAGMFLLFIFTSLWGIMGVVYATTINLIMIMVLTMFYSWYKTGIRSWPFLPKFSKNAEVNL